MLMVDFLGYRFAISEANKISRTPLTYVDRTSDNNLLTENKTVTYTNEDFRDYCNLVVRSQNLLKRHEIAKTLEAVALLAEHYNEICEVGAFVYETANDKFLVQDFGDGTMRARSIASNHLVPWEIQTNILDVLEMINKKTNANISEDYKQGLELYLEQTGKYQQAAILEKKEQTEVDEVRQKINDLSTKYANNPTKLAVLSKLSQELLEL